MGIKKSHEILKFWNEFCLSSQKFNYLVDFNFHAWSFGNNSAMADELGELVLIGYKTATCSLLRAYQGFEDEIPRVGTYSVLCNGKDRPIAVILITHMWIEKFDEIDSKHAYEEGEGDRSLEYWQRVHREFFGENYPNFSETESLLCERFAVVYK